MEAIRDQLLKGISKDYEAIIGNTPQELVQKNKELHDVIEVCTAHH